MASERCARWDETEGEQYALGVLPEREIAAFEEHLLGCPYCQDRLQETDGYVRSMRTVLPRLRREDEHRGRGRQEDWPFWEWMKAFGRPRLAWAAAALVAVLSLGWWRMSDPGEPPFAIVLTASRGSDALLTTGPESRPLRLAMDVAELPPQPQYQLAVVDSDARTQWRGVAAPAGTRVEADVGRLRRGLYFVRLSGGDGRLLREYGLRIE